MPVFLVSVEPCSHQPISKVFCALQEDTTILNLVSQYHEDDIQHVKVLCGTGQVICSEACTISFPDFEKCRVGSLSQNFDVNHFKIVCEGRIESETEAEPTSTQPPAKKSAFDVLMSASAKRGLPEKKTSRYVCDINQTIFLFLCL